MADRPIEVAYFYRTRWGHHDEFLELFTRNHLPVLHEGVRSGRMLDVRIQVPRFHGDGRADWDVLVTIVYRDWRAMEDHSEREIVARLYPDQARHKAEEQRRFELLEAHWDVPLEAVSPSASATGAATATGAEDPAGDPRADPTGPVIETARIAVFGDHKPTDVLAGVETLAEPGYLIEVDAIAVVD